MIEKLQIKKNEIQFSWHGKNIKFETGLLAPQAEGSVLVNFEGIKFLATATINKNPDPNRDFTPLIVDFREMFYSAGKIGGAPYKRKEGKPTDEAVLISRLIDRSIRPMFEEGMTNDVVLTINTLQIDKENLYGVPGIISASLAIMLAGIPFSGPIGAVRIGYKNGKYIINPTKNEIDIINLVIAGTKDTITMIEAGGEDIPTDILVKAIDIAQKELKVICEKQETFINQLKTKIRKIEITKNLPSQELQKEIDKITAKYENNFYPTNKKEFQQIYDKLSEEVKDWFNSLPEKKQTKLLSVDTPDKIQDKTHSILSVSIFKAVKKILRKHLLRTGQRLDGRTPYQVRPLYAQVGLFERTHGTGLFQRGETQVLSITTLASPGKVLLQDTLEKDDYEERFMHHYYMLPFSTNEARYYRGQGRREIGHGHLAEKTLRPIIPDENKFPYTIRIVSEVLSSNGSTSMASVCASCLSLMDAGVPIKKPVSGIAMGLVIEELSDKELENCKNNPYLKTVEINGKKFGYVILTDLQGREDFTGDMDFKVAGSKDGINALQMDMKVKGLPTFVLQQAIEQANIARKEILDFMLQTISNPRKEISPYAPKLTILKLTPDNVRDIIGKGGETIKKIINETGVAIDFKEDGTTIITAENSDIAKKAIEMINDIIWEPQIGEKILGKVIRVESFGVFVDLGRGKVGLCHISNLSKGYVQDTKKLFKEGEEIFVEVVNIKENGKIEIKNITDHNKL